MIIRRLAMSTALVLLMTVPCGCNDDGGSSLDQIAAETTALSRRLGGQLGIFGHIREGNLHIQIVVPGHEDPTSELLALVGDRGGSVSAEHGIGRDKVHFLNLRRSTAEMAAMRAIKRSLDPDGLLNPGVLFES